MCMCAHVCVSRYGRVPIHETIIICVCVHMFVYGCVCACGPIYVGTDTYVLCLHVYVHLCRSVPAELCHCCGKETNTRDI